MHYARSAAVRGVAVMLVAGAAPVALADGIEQGYKGACSAQFVPTMHARARGYLYTEGPGDGVVSYYGYSTGYTSWDDLGRASGGNWEAAAVGTPDADVDGPNTYGYCKKIGG